MELGRRSIRSTLCRYPWGILCTDTTKCLSAPVEERVRAPDQGAPTRSSAWPAGTRALTLCPRRRRRERGGHARVKQVYPARPSTMVSPGTQHLPGVLDSRQNWRNITRRTPCGDIANSTTTPKRSLFKCWWPLHTMTHCPERPGRGLWSSVDNRISYLTRRKSSCKAKFRVPAPREDSGANPGYFISFDFP